MPLYQSRPPACAGSCLAEHFYRRHFVDVGRGLQGDTCPCCRQRVTWCRPATAATDHHADPIPCSSSERGGVSEGAPPPASSSTQPSPVSVAGGFLDLMLGRVIFRVRAAKQGARGAGGGGRVPKHDMSCSCIMVHSMGCMALRGVGEREGAMGKEGGPSLPVLRKCQGGMPKRDASNLYGNSARIATHTG